ncbi:hypothetical protein HI914_03152 [Erysiphe necator]|nr:hypothetical protein HI914_03152 [Erysiphe necator]
MTSNDPEKFCHQTLGSPSPPKNMKTSKPKYLSKKIRCFDLCRLQPFWSSCFLLALIGFTIVLGTMSISPARIRAAASFPREVVKILFNEIEPLSLHLPCTRLKRSSLDKREHDDEEFLDTLRQTDLKAGRLPIDMKLSKSNITNAVEELQTAPFNSPSSMTSTSFSAPATESTASPATSHVSSSTSRVTSLSTGPFGPSLSSVISTVIIETSSLSSLESTQGSPELTTLTGKFSDHDLLTPTSDSTPPLTTTRARQTIYTTTLPNGGLSTLTSTTIIQTDVEQTNALSATKTRGTAGLQTNVAKKIYVPLGKLIGIIGIIIANGY